MATTDAESGIVWTPISYTCGPCGRIVEQCACSYITALRRLDDMYRSGQVGLVEFVQRGTYILNQAMDAVPEDMQGMIETICARTAE